MRREPRWPTRAFVVAAHSEQVREHGGKAGLRDEGSLDSALARARNTWTYETDADLALLAAEYGFGLARNHPFYDGNKRIAFVTMDAFLQLNGYAIDAPELEVVDVITRLASGRLTRDQLAEWVRSMLVETPE